MKARGFSSLPLVLLGIGWLVQACNMPARLPATGETDPAGRTPSLAVGPQTQASPATDTPVAEAVTSQTPCQTHQESLQVSASSSEIAAGEPVTLTISLQNEGCLALGLPQYRLYIEPVPVQPLPGEPILAGPIFEPANPAPVVHSLAVPPGGSDTAEFVLLTLRPGSARISAMASFEIHLGYPGPAFWASAASSPVLVRVGEAGAGRIKIMIPLIRGGEK
jgi:hypothetical protein